MPVYLVYIDLIWVPAFITGNIQYQPHDLCTHGISCFDCQTTSECHVCQLLLPAYRNEMRSGWVGRIEFAMVDVVLVELNQHTHR